MQELFGAEIAMRVFNSAQAAGGRLRAVTFSLHAFDNSETYDLVRTSPLIHNTIQLFFLLLHLQLSFLRTGLFTCSMPT